MPFLPRGAPGGVFCPWRAGQAGCKSQDRVPGDERQHTDRVSLRGSIWGFVWGVVERNQVFPLCEPPASKGQDVALLPSTEGRLDLLYPLLEQSWWKRGCGFTLLSGHRQIFP